MSTILKFWQLLNPKQRASALSLLVLMLIGMVLETFGIALVMPLLGLMTTQDLAASYPALEPWLAALGRPSQIQLVIYGTLAFVGIIAIKASLLGFLAWRQASFAFDLQADLSERLFTGYLRQPWTFHLQRNSAQLINNATREVMMTTEVSLAVFSVVTESLVILGIAILLMVVEPVGALLVVTMLGTAAWGFQRFTRARLLRWGGARQHHDGLRIQHLQQGLGGAKDVRLLGREEDFLAQFNLHNYGSARVMARIGLFQQLPRLWLELLAVIGLASLLWVMLAQGNSLNALLPSLGVFAIAAFRLMPSMGRIVNSLQSMRYSLPVTNMLQQELALLDFSDGSKGGQHIPFNAQLMLDEVSFYYPNTDKPALHSINLSIPRGSCIGIVGGSGAGKSTLVDVVLGLLTPASGHVRADSIDIQMNLRGWQDQIGYVPQSVFLTDDTLRRNVAFGLAEDKIDDAAVRRAIHSAQLDEFVDSLPERLATLVGERGVRLSGGQRQRIGIARALYHDPAVLVLDEATSSLDTVTERGVMEAVDALHGNKTILIVSHRLSTVEHCDSLVRLEQGRQVQEGSFESVMKIQEAIAT